MENIYDFTMSELEDRLLTKGYKKFNARQVFEWLYKKKVSRFEDMSNLSKKLREYLYSNYEFATLEVETHQSSKDGTEKFLFRLEDSNLIETVLMRHDYGNSVCVTTQLGCNIVCSFRPKDILKKTRDLEIEEIVLQITECEIHTNERVSHIVVMVIDEPFDNFFNTMRYIDIVNYYIKCLRRRISIAKYSGIFIFVLYI